MEILVAVFILALTVIGTARLQYASKHANYDAVQRTTASWLAEELIERMRANSSQLTVYTNAGAGWNSLALTGTAMPAPGTDCSAPAATCDSATLASYDLFQFEQAAIGVTETSGAANTGGLAVPIVCISGPAVIPGEVTLAIAWRGQTPLSNPAIHACGTGTAAYSDGANADVFRRVLVVNAFIN